MIYPGEYSAVYKTPFSTPSFIQTPFFFSLLNKKRAFPLANGKAFVKSNYK